MPYTTEETDDFVFALQTGSLTQEAYDWAVADAATMTDEDMLKTEFEGLSEVSDDKLVIAKKPLVCHVTGNPIAVKEKYRGVKGFWEDGVEGIRRFSKMGLWCIDHDVDGSHFSLEDESTTVPAADRKVERTDNQSSVESVAADQLRSYLERIERLEEEKKQIADDIKDVYAEAKGNGFDTKVMRKVIALRKQDANERAEQEQILDLYMTSLGMI